MWIQNYASISNDFIQAFNSKKYEDVVLYIMNASEKIFPNNYKKIEDQSHGECDFVDEVSGLKFDAKLPFETDQVELLTNGSKHKPFIKDWILELSKEAEEYQPIDSQFDITKTKLFNIMRNKILTDNDD